MKIVRWIVILSGLLLPCVTLESCSQDDDFQSQQNVDTNGRIYEIISDFSNTFSSGTRAKGAFKITDISRSQYSLNDFVADSMLTRVNPGKGEQFELQTVTLDFGDTKGFAIVSDDSRLNQVFFYTESGSIADTTFNGGLREVISEYPYIASDIILSGKNEITKASDNKIIQNKIVPFSWSQSAPFNNYAPYCTCSKCTPNGKHMPIGCVTTALAQTIATLGYFKGHFYGTREINFSTLPEKGWQISGVQIEQIGHFFHDIALNCQMKFGCDGSGTYTEAAYNYLKDLGYDVTFASGNIDAAKVIDLLMLEIPQLTRGSGSYGGHMWIIDGVGVSNGKFNYHCNWGWGQDNGWTLGDDSTVPPENVIQFQKDRKYIYINSKPIKK